MTRSFTAIAISSIFIVYRLHLGMNPAHWFGFIIVVFIFFTLSIETGSTSVCCWKSYLLDQIWDWGSYYSYVLPVVAGVFVLWARAPVSLLLFCFLSNIYLSLLLSCTIAQCSWEVVLPLSLLFHSFFF